MKSCDSFSLSLPAGKISDASQINANPTVSRRHSECNSKSTGAMTVSGMVSVRPWWGNLLVTLSLSIQLDFSPP